MSRRVPASWSHASLNGYHDRKWNDWPLLSQWAVKFFWQSSSLRDILIMKHGGDRAVQVRLPTARPHNPYLCKTTWKRKLKAKSAPRSLAAYVGRLMETNYYLISRMRKLKVSGRITWAWYRDGDTNRDDESVRRKCVIESWRFVMIRLSQRVCVFVHVSICVCVCGPGITQYKMQLPIMWIITFKVDTCFKVSVKVSVKDKVKVRSVCVHRSCTVNAWSYNLTIVLTSGFLPSGRLQ